MRRLCLASAVLLVTAACFGPAVDGNTVDAGGGAVTDGGGALADGGGALTDGGGALTDGGGALTDGGGPGTDAGTTDAGTTDAGAFGDGGLFGDGGTACTPGQTRCNGPRVQTCAAGVFAAPVDCPTDQVCRGSACVPVSACAGSSPPCCATSADCGTLQSFYTCPECRPSADGESCLAGVCESAPPPQIDFALLGDAMGLPGSVRITVRSAAITVYRGITADGRLVTCDMLFPATGTGPHDAQDPTLDTVYSAWANIQAGTGTNVFQVNLTSVPRGDQEAVVLSVYDGVAATGNLLGRGCIDLLAPTAGGQYTIPLK